MDKTPMYEMPLIYGFGGWGFGVGVSIFCVRILGNGILSLAVCPKTTEPALNMSAKTRM